MAEKKPKINQKKTPVALWLHTNWHKGGTQLIWCETANVFMIG